MSEVLVGKSGRPLAGHQERVWKTVAAIRDDIAAAHVEARLEPSLSGGLGGGILLNRYLHLVDPDSLYEPEAERYLDRLMAMVDRLPLTHFYGGTVGVAWLLTHLAHLDGEEPDIVDLDDILVAVLREPWQGTYDLVGGLVGVGFYGLERLPHENGRELLDLAVRRLGDLAVAGVDGTAWFTPPQFVPPLQIGAYPDGYHNLGLAHGVPGCIRLLAEAARVDVQADLAVRLLDDSVPWLLHHVQRDGDRWTLPAYAEGSGRPHARLAWCYNELGAMTAVYAAGEVRGRVDWSKTAAAILRSTCGLPVEQSGCRDACLCHGAAGVAHIYQVMADEIGDEVLRREAERWFGATLEMGKPGSSCGGYRYFHVDGDSGTQTWDPRPGFLEGAAGIGLALLAAAWDVPMGWNRILALG
ncbi:MAG: lanthionine synthetase C family protein [Candidatus Krumholzibacteria bacterium]|nr:lanthionine synthetase C family protein [Candidatus Krumholzibacteria bacterium]